MNLATVVEMSSRNITFPLFSICPDCGKWEKGSLRFNGFVEINGSAYAAWKCRCGAWFKEEVGEAQ